MHALYVLMFDAVLPAPFLRDRMAVLHRDLRRRIESGIAEGGDRCRCARGRDADRRRVAR
ncbi:hypothetical protein AOB60_35085 [Streptomyces noursei]|uniref:Uncharacterized protein n=2 Tax=Streptomyces noursei TaxID=1971 RepID=A0A2N8PDP6_STRNR|nr:hypothetical protein AOB60_35085 [Streptomyces noursei]